jgi:hypothetical protein
MQYHIRKSSPFYFFLIGLSACDPHLGHLVFPAATRVA